MANWRDLALAALLADGKVAEKEVKIIKKELWADGKIDKDEATFLVELRNAAKKKTASGRINPVFEKFFFTALTAKVLDNGIISSAEARWLRSVVFADAKVDNNEKKFLQGLKRKARKIAPEFDKLYDDCMKK
jgi:hypothetical protein